MSIAGTISSQQNRRSFLKTAATATMGVAAFPDLFSACGNTASSTGKTVTLQYWDSFVSQAAWVDQEINLFQQAHPSIKIKKTTQAGNTFNTIYPLSVRSGKVPDVSTIPGPDPLAAQVQKGWYLDWNRWATDSWKVRFPPQSFLEGTNVFNGKIYSAQLNSSAPFVQLYTNDQVFKDAGLTNSDGSAMVPHTWDDVTRSAEAITRKSNGQIAGFAFSGGEGPIWFAFMLHVFVVGAGTPQGAFGADDRVGKFTYGSDRNYTDFIDLLLDWKEHGFIYSNVMSTKDEVQRRFFAQGKIGMITNGVWAQPTWKQDGFTKYSLSALISPATTPKAYYGRGNAGSEFVISAKTKHPDESWAWIDWLYSPAAGKRWVEMGEDASIYPQNNDPAKTKDRQFAQFLETTRLTRIRPNTLLRNPQTAKVVLNGVSPDIGDVLQGIFTGQIKDIQGSLQELDARWEAERARAIKAANQQGYKVSLSDYIFPDWDPTKDYIQK
ncbi:ABC transporter substrate-binding protein [Dictyobacter kobayashii]|uniref:Sugar ABC transporter substrate-binding protein n=1 Tax=Dictyobacter kobayashii TaxID=2014872 RepID=A0A402ASR3_9CHLR|nr:ABC transporter substrate-binding protein [Dictyobacter kobayashii]GCE22156.1 hypothetical protein KDK_59560 [Dictyobacter kobayashii]